MAALVVETTELKPDAPRRAAEEGWLVATDLAEELARGGLSFHQAHTLVGELVLSSVRSNRKPGDWSAAELAAFNPLFTPALARLLSPEEGMKTRTAARRHRAGDRSGGARYGTPPSGDPVMTKNYRQGQILKLIRAKRINTQDELARELHEQAIEATQVTLSRDIREMGLAQDRRRLP